MDIESGDFVWSLERENENLAKHGLDFFEAALAFADPGRRIIADHAHSGLEARYFCIGKATGRILTVRFVYRGGKIRIFGAGLWRKGKKIYETKK